MFCCIGKYKNRSFQDPVDTATFKTAVPFIPPVKSGKVIKVYDGDTITIATTLLTLPTVYRFQVRLAGIDTAEIHSSSEHLKTLAQQSQQKLASLVLDKRIVLENVCTEKYGRILADVYVMADTGTRIHVNQWMLEHGNAVKYDGGKKTWIDTVE